MAEDNRTTREVAELSVEPAEMVALEIDWPTGASIMWYGTNLQDACQQMHDDLSSHGWDWDSIAGFIETAGGEPEEIER